MHQTVEHPQLIALIKADIEAWAEIERQWRVNGCVPLNLQEPKRERQAVEWAKFGF